MRNFFLSFPKGSASAALPPTYACIGGRAAGHAFSGRAWERALLWAYSHFFSIINAFFIFLSVEIIPNSERFLAVSKKLEHRVK